MALRPGEAPIAAVRTAAYTVPTDAPESDGTLAWDATTLVAVEVDAAGATGFGYTYSDAAAVVLIRNLLAPVLLGQDGLATRARWTAMVGAVRNVGRAGLASMAIAACDVALHDLKGRLLDVPAVTLLGGHGAEVALYGSGGFTSYDEKRLADQLSGWVADGFGAVKMKVGRQPEDDAARVAAARRAVGDAAALFVDANGAYGRKQALLFADAFAARGVTWFEEPVPSTDLDGLRRLRARLPAGMDLAAGEYDFDTPGVLALGDAVDVLQIDATRCAGYTGFMLADAAARALQRPTSSHTAPALHLSCCAAALGLRHMEWFHDHVRIERLLLDGAPRPARGMLRPDLSRPGIGLSLKHADAEPYRVQAAEVRA